MKQKGSRLNFRDAARSWPQFALPAVIAITFLMPGRMANAFLRVPAKKPINCNCRNDIYENYKEILHKVAIRGDKDDRKKDESQETSGALKVVCKNAEGKVSIIGSSQLVESGSAIVTAAHLFYDDSCSRKWDPADCAVVKLSGDKPKFYRFDSDKMHLGTNCPSLSPNKDWAVIKLKEKPKNASAVKVCEAQNLTEGQAIEMVSANSKGQGPREFHRMVQSCKILSSQEANMVLRTDCDTDGGSSGSGIFKDGCMIGIHRGSSSDLGSPPPDFTPADQYYNYGAVAPATSEMLSAIKDVSR